MMGSITKRNLEKKCAPLFQEVNLLLKVAEQDNEFWKFNLNARIFASRFLDSSIFESTFDQERFSRIAGDFRSNVTMFYGALNEYQRILNTSGTLAPPPELPYKSVPTNSDIFTVRCTAPAPFFLKFHSKCVFYLNMTRVL